MLATLSLLLVIVVILYMLLNRNKDYWRKRDIVQIDGVLPKFIFGKRSIAEWYKEFYDRFPEEKYIGYFVGFRPTVLLKDLNDISAVLQGDFQSFYGRGIVTNPEDLLADNLLLMNDYRRWKLLRQKLSPVFTHMKLKNMFYIMERCARDFVQYMETNKQLRSKPLNALYTYTTASIGASVFGIDTQTQNTMESPFMDMSWKIFEPSLLSNIRFAIRNCSPTLFRLLNLKTFAEHEKFFIGMVKNVLKSRRQSKESRHDFIDTCLELQQSGVMQDPTTDFELEPTDEVLAAQAFIFFIAGADPTATAMHFALLELSFNPSILKRLHEEIDAVFDSGNGTLTYEDLDKLVYLEQVISESMRKYPPIGSIPRTCMKNTILPSGLKVDENTVTIIPVFALHRDEKYFPNPEVFDPERFSADNISNIVKFTNLPFGGGNRICIGVRFARIQMKAGLALLLRRFTLLQQEYKEPTFKPSFFALRASKITYELVLRNS